MPSDFANLDSGSDDNLKPEFYSSAINNLLTGYGNFFNRRDLRQASNAYTSALDSLYPQSSAASNAQYYSGIAKNVIGDPNTYVGDYERIRSGNLGSLKDLYSGILDYGLGGIKARLAAGGYGNQGPSSYDRILNSTLATSNIGPVLSTIYSGLAPAAAQSYGSREAHNQNLLALLASDPLGGGR